MKNKRKLAVISLVVMMMVTAVGYAAWSDTVIATGTAKSATLDVHFELGAKSDEISTVIDSSNNDSLTFTVDKILPGELRTATLYIRNEGNVTAYKKDFNVVCTDPEIFHQYTVTKEAPAEIPAGEVGIVEIEFSLKPLYCFSMDGNMNVYKDKFFVNLTYGQQ